MESFLSGQFIFFDDWQEAKKISITSALFILLKYDKAAFYTVHLARRSEAKAGVHLARRSVAKAGVQLARRSEAKAEVQLARRSETKAEVRIRVKTFRFPNYLRPKFPK